MRPRLLWNVRLVVVLMATFLFAYQPASACPSSAGFDSLIHRSLPEPKIMAEILEAGGFIADVELLSTDLTRLTGDGIPARVIRMWRGEPIDQFVIRQRWLSSCEGGLPDGSRGWFIGMIHSYDDGRPVVVPLRATRGLHDEWGLADGFVLSIWKRVDFDLDGP